MEAVKPRTAIRDARFLARRTPRPVERLSSQPTAGAYTHVDPAPTLDASNPAPYCNGVVTNFGYNFQPGDSVRLTLLSGDLGTVMDTQYTTVDNSTGIPPGFGQTIQLHLTAGYSGPVWVLADESYPGNLTTGAYLSQAC